MRYFIFFCVITIFARLVLANDGDSTLGDLPTQGTGIASEQIAISNPFLQKEEIILHDNKQTRDIPVAMYFSTESHAKAVAGISKLPVAIINHGYGVKHTEYSFIADAIAAQGYYVLSIQQDLDADPDLPKSGNIYQKRMPFWKRGV